MQYVEDLKAYTSTEDCVVTFGKFDGLHRGHQKLIQTAEALKKEHHLKSVVCAFDMGQKEQILTKEERYRHLEGHTDVLVNCPFTDTLKQMPAKDFIRDVIGGLFHARYVVVGADFHFGYRRGGDSALLKEMAPSYGYEAVVLRKERQKDLVISTTAVKEALRAGDLPLANALLGYTFSVTGTVDFGRQLGRTLGFPTCNVLWPEDKIVPKRGVYMTRTLLEDTWYPGISNVGVKPTVSEEDRVLIESYLFGYGDDAYGKEIQTELLEFTRPERKFEDVPALKACIDQDIAHGRQYFGLEGTR